jgi:hypothetical protein
MLKVYADFCPLVVRMLELVPEGEVCEWKLRVHHPLKTWVEGNVALLGDACHPTLPVRRVYRWHCFKLTHEVSPASQSGMRIIPALVPPANADLAIR